MKVLIIGGTGFIGGPLLPQLRNQGHTIAVFHRGSSKASLPAGVEHIIGDRRNLPNMQAALRRFAPEVVIDMILSSGAQAETLMQTFRDIAKDIVAISSMDVYRACGVLHGTEN